MILVLLHQTNRVAKKTYFGKTVLYRVDVHTTHAPISLTGHTVQMSPHSLEGREETDQAVPLHWTIDHCVRTVHKSKFIDKHHGRGGILHRLVLLK